MKLLKILSCLLILSLTFANYSEAKGRSFGGGFRSQRAAPAPMKSAPAPQSPQSRSMFGSFGTKPATAAPNAQPSAMNRDMNANAAQSNALKNYDARNKVNESGAGAAAGGSGAGSSGIGGSGTGGSGWFRSGNQGGAAPASAIQSAPHTTVVHQGGGFMHNSMWFMLCNSMASHRQNYYPQQPSAQSVNQDGQVVNPTGENDSVTPPVEEKESFFMSLLRFVIWVAVIVGVYKLVKNIMQSRKNRANKKLALKQSAKKFAIFK